LIGLAVRAADAPATLQSARLLAAQQQRAEQNPLPTDLVPVQLSDVPRTVTSLFSLSRWPLWPPLPASCASSSFYSGSDFYLSPSRHALFVDDRQPVALALAAAAASPPSGDGTNNNGIGGGSGSAYGPLTDYSTNHTDLYLSILSATNDVAQLVLWNTSNAVPYEVLSSDCLTNALTNWISEGIWIGQPTNTPANIALGSRTNQLFFDAHVWSGAFDHGVPTNGQLFLQANTNLIYAVINGVTTNQTPFYSNWFMLNPPRRSTWSTWDTGPTTRERRPPG
jgi:hypothetical protein